MEAHHPESEASIAYPDKPIPRPPRSRSRLALLRVRNRRLQYLELHPSYFDNTEHELAGRPSLCPTHLPRFPFFLFILSPLYPPAKRQKASRGGRGAGAQADLVLTIAGS